MKAELSPEQLKWIKEKKVSNYEEAFFFGAAPKEWLESNEFMLAAVTKNGSYLKFASEKLKDDKEIVLAAVANNALEYPFKYALEFASDKLKDDKEIVLAAVTKSGCTLQYASTKLKADKEIVLAAVTNQGSALEYASDKLKDDKEIVLTAVAKNGWTLKYASDKLKDDKEIVLAAVTEYRGALEYASDKLKDDREFILAANEIKIGDQTWATKNLDVDTYRNGDTIPQVQDTKAWANLTTGAWCCLGNNSANEKEYGKLYNWFAVNDARGLAPKGYHIPTYAEWTVLVDNLTDNLGDEAGTKLKSTNGWNNNSDNSIPSYGTNSSGFNGLQGGLRGDNGDFSDNHSDCNWWSSSDELTVNVSESESSTHFAGAYQLSCVGVYFDGENYEKNHGFYVRCLRD